MEDLETTPFELEIFVYKRMEEMLCMFLEAYN